MIITKRRILKALFLSVMLASAAPAAQAATLYADSALSSECTSGNYNPSSRNCSGSSGKAYRTIQAAVNAASGTDTVLVRSGTYREAVTISKSGSSGSPFTLQNYSGETPVIDGANSLPANSNGLITISGQSWVKVAGLSVKNSKVYGVKAPNCNNVTLQNMEVSYSTHGGVVFETGGSNIVVDGCNIHHNNNMGLEAWHEALSLENINGFEVKNSQVWGNKEEGIDAKYGSRGGKIHHNKAYQNNGPNIYVDAAHDIDIYNNSVYSTASNNKAGIAVGVESVYNKNKLNTYNVNVYNNVVYDNGAGIWIWIENGAEAWTNFYNIKIFNNTITGNNKNNWGGIMTMGGSSGNYSSGNVISNNIFWDNTSGGGKNIRDDVNAMGKFTVSNNLFKSGEASSTTGAGQVSASDIRFTNASGRDYSLQSGSPAIDKGSASLAPSIDYADKARPSGSGVDIGAYEYGGTVQQAVSAPSNLRIVAN